MSPAESPPSWTDPRYVAAVVGVLATGAVVFYSALTPTGPTVEEVVFALLAVMLPATAAYEVARRFG
ncbi:hypothetical protein SAMN04487947_2545 [Halogeometricum rufum]|uniref:Uncharacterized protein n=1 Tax=Halogeometricum rufum TaxID=553469 RepID=A0A1I6HV43_9EURY|nr:hypothetical protein [Halogeometricum rufum]SFR58315.1 hypothetical protein SAMN04487947_2545 [Halogeometricum rufum]